MIYFEIFKKFKLRNDFILKFLLFLSLSILGNIILSDKKMSGNRDCKSTKIFIFDCMF